MTRSTRAWESIWRVCLSELKSHLPPMADEQQTPRQQRACWDLLEFAQTSVPSTPFPPHPYQHGYHHESQESPSPREIHEICQVLCITPKRALEWFHGTIDAQTLEHAASILSQLKQQETHLPLPRVSDGHQEEEDHEESEEEEKEDDDSPSPKSSPAQPRQESRTTKAPTATVPPSRPLGLFTQRHDKTLALSIRPQVLPLSVLSSLQEPLLFEEEKKDSIHLQQSACLLTSAPAHPFERCRSWVRKTGSPCRFKDFRAFWVNDSGVLSYGPLFIEYSLSPNSSLVSSSTSISTSTSSTTAPLTATLDNTQRLQLLKETYTSWMVFSRPSSSSPPPHVPSWSSSSLPVSSSPVSPLADQNPLPKATLPQSLSMSPPESLCDHCASPLTHPPSNPYFYMCSICAWRGCASCTLEFIPFLQPKDPQNEERVSSSSFANQPRTLRCTHFRQHYRDQFLQIYPPPPLPSSSSSSLNTSSSWIEFQSVLKEVEKKLKGSQTGPSPRQSSKGTLHLIESSLSQNQPLNLTGLPFGGEKWKSKLNTVLKKSSSSSSSEVSSSLSRPLPFSKKIVP